MELFIPFVALGSMYMASRDTSTNTSINVVQTNTSKSSSNNSSNAQSTREGFEEESTFSRQQLDFRQQKAPSAIMDPSNIQPNYPPVNYLATDPVVVPPTTLYEYPSQSLDANKYLNQTSYEERVNKGALPGNKLPNIYSLSGSVLSGSEFKHNNMVPFTGSKVAGSLYDDKYAENILDNMNGSGSLQFKKTEQSPLFDPSENIQYAYGAPNSSDFYQSRVNAGRSQNNTKPWESVHVGPGLDDGFSSKGIGGYNSGMEHRDKWLPKTVDELRVDTNPKMEYSLDGHEGPVQTYVKEIGKIGEVDRKLPDSFFINSPNRWLTTTGAQKGETLRADQPTGMIKRPNSDNQYVGPAGNKEQPTALSKDNYEASKREPSKSNAILGASSTTTGNSATHQNRLNNYVQSTTNRQQLPENTHTYGAAFGGFVGSVIAPIVDILRPSRKEEMVNNIRIYGYPVSSVAGATIKPQDVPKVTNKETTLYTPRTYVNNQKGLNTYVNNNIDLPINNRNQSSTYVTGCAGGSSTKYGETSIESSYAQTSNNIKSQTIQNRTALGNMSLFNNNINMSLSKPDVSQQDGYMGPVSSLIKLPPSADTYGHVVLPNKTSITEADQQYNQKRMDPSMLQAFYNNPYTHSLIDAV
jgi:hypothetical protein